jgi:phenylacetate-CoA ligase
MSRVQGRDDDVLIIKGVNVFPSQIETVLVEMEGTEPHWQIVVERRGALDEATVRVELSGPVGERLTVPQAQVREAIRRRLASELNISVEVTLLSPGTLDRTEGKARRVVDLRQK